MKKVWLAAPMMALLLAACADDTTTAAFEEAMSEGEKSVREGEYEKAIQTFHKASEEYPKNEQAKSYSLWTEELVQMRKLSADGRWDEALGKADDILSDESLPGLFQAELERFKRDTQTVRENTDSLDRQLLEAGELADDGDPQNASSKLDILMQSKEWKEYGNALKTKAEEVRQRIDAAEKKRIAEAAEEERLAKDEQEKQERLAAEEKKKQEAAASKKRQATNGTQALYLQKLEAIELGLVDLDPLYKEGLPELMIQGEQERHQRWDDALNEIYGVLKKQLSAGEMDALRQKQRNWLVFRDNEAEVARNTGGTVGERNYHGTLAYLTQERCYELVQGYMK